MDNISNAVLHRCE